MLHRVEHPELSVDAASARRVNQQVNLRLLAAHTGPFLAAAGHDGRLNSVRLDTGAAFVRPWPAAGALAPSRNLRPWTAETTSAAGRRLSLVLPAFNEEAGVRQAVVEADDALAALADDYEILVVDDGSRDATAAVVAEADGGAAARPPAAARSEPGLWGGAANGLRGGAVRFGLLYRCGLSVLPCRPGPPHSADGSLPRRRRLARGARKIPVCAACCPAATTCLPAPFSARACGIAICALKVFRRDALASILPEANGFFVNVEMLTRARQLGYEVAETGVRHRPRARGKSTVSPWRRSAHPRRPAAVLVVVGAVPWRGGRSAPAPSRRPPLAALALLLVVAGLLFFSRLHAPLLEPQEPRYAEIPRQMLARRRLLTPVLNGQPYLDKPPLLYWAVMASYAVFGVHDWAARLVPALRRPLHGPADLLLGPARGRRTGRAVRGAGALPVGAVRLPGTRC